MNGKRTVLFLAVLMLLLAGSAFAADPNNRIAKFHGSAQNMSRKLLQ